MKSPIIILYNLHLRYPVIRPVLWSCITLIIAGVVFFTVFRISSVSTSPVGWEKSYLINPPDISAKNPHIVSKGNFLIATFEGYKNAEHGIYVSLSFNGGKSFLAPRKIAAVSSGVDHNPHVSVAGNGNVAVVWQNIVGSGSNSRIFTSLSKDMGATFADPRQAFPIKDLRKRFDMEMLPRVYYDDRNVLHVFYHGLRGNSFNLYHSTSEDGNIFSMPESLVDVSGGLRGAFFPSIHFSGSNIFLVWQGRSLSEDKYVDNLYFIKSGNYGSSWSSSRLISRSNSNNAAPSILLRKDTLYLAYQNNERKTWGIYFKKGFNMGSTWEAVPELVSDTESNCYSPIVLKSNPNELSFLWHDLRKRHPAIFFRKYSILEKSFSDSVMISKGGVTARNPVAVSSGKRIVVLWKEGTRIRVNYSDVYAEPPEVFSKTHPENVWSRSNSALVQWKKPEDESGIVGYVHVINNDPDFIPPPVEPTLKGNQEKFLIPGMDDGISYFHIRSVDGAGNFSRTVHYKIQVSSNPLQITDITSPTHPYGKAVKSDSPVFSWDVNDLQRVKGFIYSISKDKISEPDIFTTDFNVKFSNLEEGRYYFNIRAVDKTSFPGVLGNYEIIVGKAKKLDIDYIKEIARQKEKYSISHDKKEGVEEKIARRVVPAVPSIDIGFPFNGERPIGSHTFTISIIPKNIARSSIDGYSINVDTKKVIPDNNVNLKSNSLSIRDLKNGKYYIAVKAKYHTIKNGRKQYHWTNYTEKSFTVLIPVEVSPVLAYTNCVLQKVSSKWAIITLSLLTMVLTIMTIGFGSRISFYINLLRFRVASRIRLFFW